MAKNIEIKARANNFSLQAGLAEEVSGKPAKKLVQIDTFFNVEKGRLKLREFHDRTAQLIFYRRDNLSGPKVSEYHICEIADPEGLKIVLDTAYGTGAIVSKNRQVFLHGRTRIHFDQVTELGDFIELEVVLAEAEPYSDGESEAHKLMELLQIQKQDLVSEAYVDLLSNKLPSNKSLSADIVTTDSTSELDATVVRQLVYR